MLRPKQMSHAVIVGHKDLLKQTVDTLHDINALHIEDFNEGGEFGQKIGKPFENAAEVSKKLVKIRSISSFLGLKPEEVSKQSASSLFKELDTKLARIDEEVSEKIEEKTGIENQLKDIESLSKELLPLSGIPVDLDLYRGYDHLEVFAGITTENIEPELLKITQSYELFSDPNSGTIVLFVLKENKEQVSKLLSGFEFKELKVPEMSGVTADVLLKFKQDTTNLENKLESLNSEISSLRSKYSEFILASDELLSIETQKAEAPLRIATTDSTFMIDGWVPDEEYDRLTHAVDQATSGRAFVSKVEITKEDEKIVPIEYDNPKISKPFEEIMDLHSRPRYYEIDPTYLIFIVFPLFYGMILGDIGYGLILWGIAAGIKKMVSSDILKSFMDIMIYCQISTLIFGVLYGEILGFPLSGLHTEHGYVAGLIPGFETIELFASPIGNEIVTFPVHRTHLAITLIALTGLIGLIHVNLGFLIGFINENKKHGINAAILEKGSWIIIEIGVLLAVLGTMGYLPTAIGIAVSVIGLVMLIKAEGISGPIELPSLLSNPLSYTRIAAVGLSSVYIATTINQIAFDMLMPEKFGIMTLVAIMVFLFGHVFNLILSVLSPTVHSLRLHYVEFFMKFYEGGGRKFDSFGFIRKYTEE
jgi:V/A-type H+-transporting ATPase subunit I